ncbi:hypothetical protein swp_4225 [Shewanella piezotolerans WP3]|uniref:Uncharacterized protein n=1 Tax=Shewanella piezotolerans (strain WP3 / JCM 13877) TaxID=225849 RepID=B8CU24_SHEPW|nr:hypothetical protein [Shewanella piezotolerans]ACJ30880.1 hypothetical protein swp_4225 [Shewanella piezotolerans WP3]
MYQHNGVCFEYPDSWEVIDDDNDDLIRAITIECPNEGYYTIDIYNSEQAPSIENYIERSLKYFIKELPFGFKMLSEPSQDVERTIHQKSEIEGLKLEFIIRTLFRHKIKYINSYFRVQSGSKISHISGQFLAEHEVDSVAGFNKIIASYSSV